MVGMVLPLFWPAFLARVFIPAELEANAAAALQSHPYIAPHLGPSHAFDSARLPPAPDYANTSAWGALHPRTDTADMTADGAWGGAESQSNAPADVFFLHPTTYYGTEGWNAPFDLPGAVLLEDEAILFQQVLARKIKHAVPACLPALPACLPAVS